MCFCQTFLLFQIFQMFRKNVKVIEESVSFCFINHLITVSLFLPDNIAQITQGGLFKAKQWNSFPTEPTLSCSFYLNENIDSALLHEIAASLMIRIEYSVGNRERKSPEDGCSHYFLENRLEFNICRRNTIRVIKVIDSSEIQCNSANGFFKQIILIHSIWRLLHFIKWVQLSV